MDFINLYNRIRNTSLEICSSLETEDYVVQPVVDVSPPKWHLGHTTWFFETFLLKPYLSNYKEYNPEFNYVFNSYYETIGARVLRTDRGNLSRPSVKEVYKYREHVDEQMKILLEKELKNDIQEILLLGLNHEQQHQELLRSDIKYILGHNPLFPAYDSKEIEQQSFTKSDEFITIAQGIYEIGFDGKGFCFDNELNRHAVLLPQYQIGLNLITNEAYLEFIKDGGYKDFRHWHSEAWDWIKTKNVTSPLYWHFIDGEWCNYTPQGLKKLALDQPVCHVSYYEATAFAAWKGMRLPTEFEWEAAANNFAWGSRWEWTESAYLPYPGFKKAPGAIGEYNGKFMVNQMVLRGASMATSQNHSRKTYRNFFHPFLQWQFTGIRLAK